MIAQVKSHHLNRLLAPFFLASCLTLAGSAFADAALAPPGPAADTLADLASDQQSDERLVETSLHDIKVRPINGGINPMFSALEVSGTVLVGSNPCMAAGVKASLDQAASAGRIQLTAHLDQSAQENRICTREYNPQYASVRTAVYYHRGLVQEIVIRHAEALGQEREVSDYLDR